LYERLRTGSARRKLERTMSEAEKAPVDDQLARLCAGLEAGDVLVTRDASRALASAAAPVLAWRRQRDSIGFVATIAGAAAGAFALRACVAEPYVIKSSSMLPTLEISDRIGGNKLAVHADRPPRRGDIVVFRASSVALGPNAVDVPPVIVKRVFGLPGDHIEMRGTVPVINGWEVPGCTAGDYFYLLSDASGRFIKGRLTVEFLEDRAYLALRSSTFSSFRGTYIVKPGEVFVLGDNRNNSLDSRSYNDGQGGGVPLNGIQARADWFLTGTHRSGELDLGRLLRPLDRLEEQLRLEGINAQTLEQGIAACLKNRPTDTRPPPALGEGVTASRN
jgi:signal peptidase I